MTTTTKGPSVPEDTANMRTALALARRGLGRVWPNPAVGCLVIAEDGTVAGRGWTQPGGRPHAETEALDQAAEKARGATVYVTLEPCSHQGETPPCADALIAAGIKRAVIACEDPDERVSGSGIARLEGAGVEVTLGIGAEDAADLNAGFFLKARENRPLFTVKTATTLDGNIATRSGHSQWITGEEARATGHLLRSEHDAILTGIGTALADDPQMTCRLPGLEDRSPVRVILDSRLQLPLDGFLARNADKSPTWLITVPGSYQAKRQELSDLGVEIIDSPAGTDGRPDLKAVAALLAERGLTRVLVEGGGTLTAAFFKRDLVDRLAWFHAPAVIGGDGTAAVSMFGVDSLTQSPRFVRTGIRELGVDILETYRRAD